LIAWELLWRQQWQVSFRRIRFRNSQRSGEELLQKAMVNNEFVELENREVFTRRSAATWQEREFRRTSPLEDP
jgi:hypothetical protein